MRQINPNQSVLRLFFDILHGIDRADIPLVVALEFAIFLGYDGQLKQNSDMEMELFESTIDQFRKIKMTKIENALMWLYVKSWGLQGKHVIDRLNSWIQNRHNYFYVFLFQKMGLTQRIMLTLRVSRFWSNFH